MKMNHLGYATRNLEEAIDAFLKLGYTTVYEDIKHHEPKNMYVQRVQLGDLIVELMATVDTSKPSFVSEKLEATTEPFLLHHLCYDVDDIHKTVDDLMATGDYHSRAHHQRCVSEKSNLLFEAQADRAS